MSDLQGIAKSSRPLLALVVVMLVVAVMAYGLFWTQQMGITRTNLANAAMEISVEITEAQLSTHKALTNQNIREIDQVWLHIETANRYAQTICKGGRVKGHQIPPCEDAASFILIDSLRNDLTSLAHQISNWLETAKSDSFISPPESLLEITFEKTANKSELLEAAIHDSISTELFFNQALQIGLIILSMICIGWVLIWIRKHERLRQKNLDTLAAATRNLTSEVDSRKKAESTLRDKEHLLSTTLDSTADGILVVNSEGRTVLANAQFAHIWSIPDQMMADRNDETMLNYVLDQLEDPQAFLSKVRLLYNSPDKDMDTLAFKNGQIIERYSCPLLDGEKIMGRVWSFRDITERAQSEEALRESESNYQDTLNTLPFGVIVHAVNTTVILTNQAACTLLGTSSANLRRQRFDRIPWPFVRADGSRMPIEEYPVNKVLATNQPIEQLTMGVDPPDVSDRIWLQVNAFPLRNKNKTTTRVVVSMADVTNLKKTEIALSQRPGTPVSIEESAQVEELAERAVKLEVAGQIAGQVAHDFNNLLGPLMAYPDLIRDELPENHPALELVNVIEQSAKHIAEINQELLTLGRRGQLNMSRLNLNDIITLTINHLDFSGNDFSLEIELAENLPAINGGQSQLIRVLSNLIVNAHDACGENGRVVVRTFETHLDKEIGQNDRIPPGDYVKVSISDNGCGIPKEIVASIFDPFFSTKKTDRKRGSGLGLSVVHAVMKDHLGYIDLESTPSEGTTFFLYFPIILSPSDKTENDDTTVNMIHS